MFDFCFFSSFPLLLQPEFDTAFFFFFPLPFYFCMLGVFYDL